MKKANSLKSYPIFKNSIQYNDNVNYEGTAISPRSCAADAIKDHAEELKDAIFDLMLAGKLDKTDIALIHARDCSPMPSNNMIAKQLRIPRQTVDFRIGKIKGLIESKM